MVRNKEIRRLTVLSENLLFAGFWILVWFLAARTVDIPFLLPTPAATFRELFSLFGSPSFYRTVLRSLLSLSAGFSVGAIAGILLAPPSAFFPHFARFSSPVFTVIRATPVASFIMIAWVFLENNALPAFICALMTAPIVWNSLHRGLRSLDRSLLEVARVYGFSRRKTLRVYWMPSLLPFLSSGFTTALGLAWKASIATEILVKPSESIGYAIWDAKAWSMNTANLFAWTMVVILISLIFEYLLSRFFRIGVQKRKESEYAGHPTA